MCRQSWGVKQKKYICSEFCHLTGFRKVRLMVKCSGAVCSWFAHFRLLSVFFGWTHPTYIVASLERPSNRSTDKA